MLHVIGHKSPDTDSVASAIAYAHFKNELGEEAKPFILGELNNETKHALKKFNIKTPEILKSVKNKDVILVDHNEFSQNLEDISEANIREIIDHHKLNFSYNQPIYVLTMPLGSTATIITNLYLWSEIDIPKDIAGMLLSAILSDTVIFKSPTTTEEDKELAEMLSEIAGIQDIEKYGTELFEKKSDLSNKTIKELLYNDYKISSIKDTKIMVSQLEVINDQNLLTKKPDFLKEMEKIKQQENLSAIILLITNIMKEGSTMIILADNYEPFEKAYNTKFKDNEAWLPGVLSRKKQVLPPLYETLG